MKELDLTSENNQKEDTLENCQPPGSCPYLPFYSRSDSSYHSELEGMREKVGNTPKTMIAMVLNIYFEVNLARFALVW